MNLEIQKKLYELFSVLSFPFVDGVQDVPFPYGSFGYSTNTRLNTKTSVGNAVFIQLDLFSNYNGQLQVKNMEQEVLDVLSKPIVIDGRDVFLADWSFQILREPDVYHGVLEITLNIY